MRPRFMVWENVSDAFSSGTPRGEGFRIVLEEIIRRLAPLKCERLQGFPDDWTDVPSASDSARYKALDNSVAIPCADYVLYALRWCFEPDKRK